MFYAIYYLSFIVLIPGLIVALIAEVAVKRTYTKYRKISSQSNWTASDMSRMLLERSSAVGVTIAKIPGDLTDNYNPSDYVLSLSEAVYDSNSIAALGIAAHEVGHAIQHSESYGPLKFRSFMVKVVNIGSRLALPLAIIGLLIEWLAASAGGFGEFVIFLGIIAYSLSTIFALITLPVEINASRRAKKLLLETGVLTKDETRQAGKVLNAAALTYVASLVISILYLLRFILIILSFRRSD